MFYLLLIVLFINLDSFGELSTSGDISRRDFCLLSNIMGLNGVQLVVLTDPRDQLAMGSNLPQWQIGTGV